jgi:dATP/dGTP diphosphohydrolase
VPTSVENSKVGVKFDQLKLRWDLLPIRALIEVVKVYTLGCLKYADRNWEKGLSWCRMFAALQRHAWAWFLGQISDSKDGQKHMASVAWIALGLLEFEHTHPELDDRPKLTEAEATEYLNTVDKFLEDYAKARSTTKTT